MGSANYVCMHVCMYACCMYVCCMYACIHTLYKIKGNIYTIYKIVKEEEAINLIKGTSESGSMEGS